MRQSTSSSLVAFVAATAFALTALPALAVTVEYTHVTFSVPVTVNAYPAPPEGDEFPGIECLVSRGSKQLGRGAVGIPLGGNPRGYSGKPIVIQVFMKSNSEPAQTGDQYECRIVGDWTLGKPVKKSWNPSTSALVANGTLP